MTPDADRPSLTLRHHRQLARLVQRLDDELGLHHGLSWSDLLLLDALHDAGGRMSARQGAAAMGRSPAGLLRQALPMEKIGLVLREREPAARRARHGAHPVFRVVSSPVPCSVALE